MPISSVHGSFGEHLGRPKRAHGSHNDVRRLCWPNLGCESPLVETPKGSLCWENLCGWGCLVGGTDWERTYLVIIYRPRDTGLELFSSIFAPKIGCGLYTSATYPRGFTVHYENNTILWPGFQKYVCVFR